MVEALERNLWRCLPWPPDGVTAISPHGVESGVGDGAAQFGRACTGILDALREHVWARYGLQIQQVLRDQRSPAIPAADDIDVDEADVPF